jgi:hypothetical protein
VGSLVCHQVQSAQMNGFRLRLYPDLERRVDEWASKQFDKPGRPEAIRRLIEVALAKKPKRFSRNQ